MEQVNKLECIFTNRPETSVDQDQLAALFYKLDMSAFYMSRVNNKIFKCIQPCSDKWHFHGPLCIFGGFGY